MGKKSYYGSYSKSSKKGWSKDIKNAIRDITDSVIKNIASKKACTPNICVVNRAARICIYALILVTLLFSGVGFYSWVIIGMLCLVLQFV